MATQNEQDLANRGRIWSNMYSVLTYNHPHMYFNGSGPTIHTVECQSCRVEIVFTNRLT